MQNINLLPKGSYIERFAVFIIIVIVLIGAGFATYTYFEVSFIDDESNRVKRQLTYLEHNITELDARLEEIQALKAETEKKLEVAELIDHIQLNWPAIIDTIIMPQDDIRFIPIGQTTYNDTILTLEIEFASYEQLHQYEQSLLRSPLIHFVDIQHIRLNRLMDGEQTYYGQVSIYLQR